MLGLDTVGAHDNFFDLGGNSLKITVVSSELKKRLGREVTLVELFTFPTVKALADHLSGGTDVGPIPPVPDRDVSIHGSRARLRLRREKLGGG